VKSTISMLTSKGKPGGVRMVGALEPSAEPRGARSAGSEGRYALVKRGDGIVVLFIGTP
jgi:hypothetical protein